MKVYVSTAERSGLLYASLIAQGLKTEQPDVEIIWGDRPAESEATVGFAAGARQAGSIREKMRRIERGVRSVKPDVFLAVAWSEPNTLLGLRLRDMKQMRRVFFAPPQLWAWGRFRATLLKKGYDALLCLYPGEAKFLTSLGLPAYFAGNPLARHLAQYSRREKRTKKPARTIALLAGSRHSEKSRHQMLLSGFMRRWREFHPNDKAVWLFLTEREALRAERFLDGHDKAVGGEERYRVLAKTDLAVVTSGTASLETALLGIPQVVFYSLSGLEMTLIKSLTRVRLFALPNIILTKRVVPELLNPSVDELLEHGQRTICRRKESCDIAKELHLALTPLDNTSSFFRLILK